MLLKQCCDLLEQQKLKIAFIESASSGYLSAQFSIYKNSGADILLGGLVSYDPQVKIDILQIDPTLIQQHSAESKPVTEAMAQQGQLLFKTADVIVACTGLLKPGGSVTPDKPEGTFFIAITYRGEIYSYHYLIHGDAIQRLNQLSTYVAIELIKLVQS